MSPSFLRFCFVMSGALAALASPSQACADEQTGEHAGEHAGETEGARLFREGRALMLAERFSEACPRLEQSQRVEPHGGTLLNVAACHERLGRIGTAWAEFHDALVAARTEGQAARVRLAEQRLAALQPRLPWLTITVSADAEAQGVRVTYDGAELQRIAWGKDMPIDPGEHVVVITAAGHAGQSHRIVAREAERQTLHVSALEETPVPVPEPRLTPTPAPVVVEPVEPPVAPAAPRLGRWVFEAGLFAAYMTGSMDRARLDGDEASVAVEQRTESGTETTSCASVRCSYSLGRRSSLAGGVSLFAGYAATDWLHIGGRLIAGPRLRGGLIVATGPSASMHMWGPLWVGASLYLGVGSQSERSGTVTPEPPYTLSSTDYHAMTASTDVAFGVGFELRAELFRTASGAFALNAQPLFLSGSPGSVFVLPIGISYRWR